MHFFPKIWFKAIIILTDINSAIKKLFNSDKKIFLNNLYIFISHAIATGFFFDIKRSSKDIYDVLTRDTMMNI